MRTIRVIGIGSGDPEHLTGAAWGALRASAYVLAARKRDDDPLLAVRRALCERMGVTLVEIADAERDRDLASTRSEAGYTGAVRDWHQARVTAYAEAIAGRDGDVGFLVWGDPALYDSTLRIVERLVEVLPGTTYEVVPGLAAPHLLAAAHRIVLHPVGRPVLVTTGRRLATDLEGGADNVVVMLDPGLACLDAAVVHDPADWRIWWGANLGTASEQLVAGPLDEVAGELRTARARAGASGWVMDTYLLRRTGTCPVP